MFRTIIEQLRAFPRWVKASRNNQLILVRFLLLALNFLIFAAAVIWVVLQFKGAL